MKQQQIYMMKGMLDVKNENISSQKQNKSPEVKKKNNVSKQYQIIRDLCRIIKQAGIELPKYLTIDIKQKASLVSQQYLPLFGKALLQNQVNILKVKLADSEFQTKKLEQDFAQYKLLAKMEKQKCVRKLKQELEQYRLNNQNESQKWQTRFYQRMKKYEKQTNNFYQQTKNKYETQKQQALTKLSIQIKIKQKQLQHNNTQVQDKCKQWINKTTSSHCKDLQQMSNKHQYQIKQLKKKGAENIKITEEHYQHKIIIIQCQKKAEIKAVEEVKKQATINNEKYLTQIISLTKQKNKFQQTISQLNLNNKVLNKKLLDKNVIIEDIQKYNLQYMQRVANEQKKYVQNLVGEFDDQKIQILKYNYSKIQQLQQTIKKIDESKIQMQKRYGQLYTIQRQRYEKRESKPEDLQMIKNIQIKLTVKEMQVAKFYQQLKSTQLERQNNEKNYMRIFTANGSRQKKICSTRDNTKQYKYIQCILRQSHTADLRHLLKISHK